MSAPASSGSTGNIETRTSSVIVSPDNSRYVFMLEIARLLGLEPDSKTLAKILVLQELLKKGYSVRKALASARLGWKSYYKYSPLIYSDPDILIPIPKKFLRDYSILRLDLKGLRIALNEIAKFAALVTIRKALINRKIRRGDVGRKWLQLAGDLMMAWIHEVSISLVEHM